MDVNPFLPGYPFSVVSYDHDPSLPAPHVKVYVWAQRGTQDRAQDDAHELSERVADIGFLVATNFDWDAHLKGDPSVVSASTYPQNPQNKA